MVTEQIGIYLFVNGLPPSIKEKVECDSELVDREEVKKKTRQAESAYRKTTRPLSVNEIKSKDKKKGERGEKGQGKKKSGWIFCYKCKQWGDHIKATCPRTKEEIAELKPANPYEAPEGESKDATSKSNSGN